jgi:hypothetical protein
MPKRSETTEERNALIGDGKCLDGSAGELPSPVGPFVVGASAKEDGVGLRPHVRTAPAGHCLRLRPVDEKPAEALELAAFSEVDEPVVGEAVGREKAKLVLWVFWARHRARWGKCIEPAEGWCLPRSFDTANTRRVMDALERDRQGNFASIRLE